MASPQRKAANCTNNVIHGLSIAVSITGAVIRWKAATGGTTLNRLLPLVLFLVLAVGGGMVIGALTAPGAWYAELTKPSFNPPGWVFGPVWTVLYVMIGLAGWLSWQNDPAGLPMKLWWAQMALNFMWSPAFFSAQQIGLALVVILLLLAVILWFIIAAWNRNRRAALLFLPYAAWVAFAALLNATIFAIN